MKKMNETEFTNLIETTKGYVLDAIKKNLNYEYFHNIDDVAQNTYLRVYKNVLSGKFQKKSKITTWIYKIASNEAKRMNKKLNREQEKYKKAADNNPVNNKENYFDIIHNENEFNEIINILPEKFKNVIYLYSTGLNESEISNKLKIKKGTVKSRISRAKTMLQKIIHERRLNEG